VQSCAELLDRGAWRRRHNLAVGLFYGVHLITADCPGEVAWIDPPVAAVVAGGRPGSTTTRVPILTRL
jgi:hypothetical protein